ncbi:multicopper oxidase domain-containing protein [Euzebya sp.]|uniref:multicopper oxidase domain-containing protein n=1 Tax=Euzebya sp. TaxID=1971409 RepID=UPI0035143545
MSKYGPAGALLAVMTLVALVLSAMAFQGTRDGDGDVAIAEGEAAGEDAAAPDAEAPAEGEQVAVTDGAASSVDVGMTEFAFDPDALTVGEGGTVNVTNDGSIPHNLTVKGYEEQYATADLNGGDSAAVVLAGLAQGEYDIYCTIAGHEAAGMSGTLTVAAPGTGDGTVVADDAEGVGDEVATDDGEELTGMARAEWLRANYEESVSQFPAETSALGSQPMEPTEVLGDGTKVFELVLDETEWEVAPGEFVEAVAYNGQVPGPWISVDVGDDVTIRLVNELDDEATTLHPHGIFMHPFEVDGVGMISMDPIMPGDVWEGSFTTQETSVGMYHGHDNGVHQVINGAFGAFTVGQVPLPAQADNVVAEEVMILNDAGEIGLTLNGKSFPATTPYVLTEGEQMILHYYNEGLTAHPMHLHNNAQMVIAKDGYPLATPIVMDTVNVAPGERYTVVIFAESPGTWVYHCHILSHVERDDGSVFGMFTALIVEPSDDPAVNDDLSRELGRDQIPTFPGQAATSPDAATDPDAAADA